MLTAYHVSDIKTFLESQSNELQKYTERKSELERMIQYHQNIQTHRTIPRKFKPSSVPTSAQPNTTLVDDFNQKYETLFFSHLNKVISANLVSLEVTKSAIENVLMQTENHLSSAQIPSLTLTQLYEEFLANNHVTNHTPLPVLQAKLTKSAADQRSDATPNKKRKRKRDRDQEQDASETKRSKSFLFQGPLLPQIPP